MDRTAAERRYDRHTSTPPRRGFIGTVRRECLDRTLFWNTSDLEAKLLDFQQYYNEHRGGLYQTPIAA